MCKPSPDQKLEILHNIQDRRLKENTDPKHHMEDKCKLIPDSLSDVDLENTRWHRGCYQHFTMTLNCFQSESPAMLEDAQPSSSWAMETQQAHLISVTLRHLYRSKQLITILNRLSSKQLWLEL